MYIYIYRYLFLFKEIQPVNSYFVAKSNVVVNTDIQSRHSLKIDRDVRTQYWFSLKL